MRWNTTPFPKDGNTRIVTKFLLLPKCIKNEWRWLETATYEEVYRPGADGGVLIRHWCSQSWVDDSTNRVYPRAR